VLMTKANERILSCPACARLKKSMPSVSLAIFDIPCRLSANYLPTKD
jgi:hypothetical protein